MALKSVGIEAGRKTLGDLVTAVQQGARIVLTRNGKPAAQLVRYPSPATAWDLADLVSPADIAVECGASKPAVSNWIARYPDFPQPLTTVAQGSTALFSRVAVLEWYDRKDWKNDGPGSKTR